ncbi:MAG TPA: energy-coupling factor transporter transmembrane protein EcfT [Jiangellaceae bacterium]
MNTYLAGTSWLHRTPASAKLVGLLVLLATTLMLSSPVAIALAGIATAALYATAGLAGAITAQLRPMRWLVLGLFGLQVLTAGWVPAVVVTGRLVVAVVLAGLVTLTTRVVDLLDVLERVLRPMRRIGVDSERVALMLALAIRAVPVVAGLAGEVRDAQRARGIASPRAFAVPFVVRSLRHADGLGEALAARGLDN